MMNIRSAISGSGGPVKAMFSATGVKRVLLNNRDQNREQETP